MANADVGDCCSDSWRRRRSRRGAPRERLAQRGQRHSSVVDDDELEHDVDHVSIDDHDDNAADHDNLTDADNRENHDDDIAPSCGHDSTRTSSPAVVQP